MLEVKITSLRRVLLSRLMFTSFPEKDVGVAVGGMRSKELTCGACRCRCVRHTDRHKAIWPARGATADESG